MRRLTAIPCIILFNLIDVSLTTVFFSHGKQFHYHFTRDVFDYRFNQSLFDLWVLSLVRSVFLLGASFGVCFNIRDGSQRVVKLKPAVVVAAVLMWSFNIIKLLVISETVKDVRRIWLLSMLSWTALASVLFYVQWIFICKISQSGHNFNRAGDLIINSATDERDERKSLIGQTERASSSDDKNKDDKTEDDRISRASLFRLLSYSKPDWFLLLLGFIFLVGSATGEIFIPFYTGLVIDEIAIEKSKSKFISAIVTMAVLSVVSAICSGLRGGCFMVAMSRLNIRIRNLLFFSIVRQEIGFFDKVRTGDITSRLTSDITTMSDTVALNMNVFLRSLIKGGGVIVFMFNLSWQLTFVTIVGMPLIVGVSKLYGKYYKKLSKAVQDSLAVANDIAEEVCSSMRTVRSFANEEGEAGRYKTSLKDTYKLQKKQAVAYAGYTWCTQLFELSLSVAVLYYGGHLVVDDRITGGNLVSFILYQFELGNCVQGIGAVYTGLMQAAGASEKVFEYIDRKPEIHNDGGYRPDNLSGRLEFQNVRFSYPTRPDMEVLKSLSFRVNPGEVVALVGPSGGGKSSCVNLLERFYESMSGQILLDGTPIQQYDHKYLHQKIALVGQEPVLYARSIQENIAYGNDAFTEDKVIEAAEMANAHRFILDMPDRYETMTGEKGMQLSGGQKQRIAIARALIRNPVILILDEATSALDAESEHVVQQAIYKNLKGRTVVIIAHRLSTVERADRIIVIDKGIIVQHGKHRDLVREDGLYAKLVQRQLLSGDSLHSDPTDHAAINLQMSKCRCACTCVSTSHSYGSAKSHDSFKVLHEDSASICESPLQVSFRIGSA